MNSYRYKVTVEMVAGAKGEPVEGRSLTFEAANHDDILAIAERMKARLPFDGDTAASLAIGLKLLSEVALVHRKDPLFAEVRPALSEFIGAVKRWPEVASPAQDLSKEA